MRNLAPSELARATGGQVRPYSAAAVGVNALAFLDYAARHPEEALGIMETGEPHSMYVPAHANADGSVTPGSLGPPRQKLLPSIPRPQ